MVIFNVLYRWEVFPQQVLHCIHNWYNCSPISPRLEIVACNFNESSSFVLYSLNVAMLGSMFTHIIKLLCVSFRCFLSMLAFSNNNYTKRSLGIFSSAAYAIMDVWVSCLSIYCIFQVDDSFVI